MTDAAPETDLQKEGPAAGEATTLRLNSSHRLHLVNNCKYADKLLGEIEQILAASASKSPFPRYQMDVSPAQRKVVEDYIARIRAQVVRLFQSYGISPEAPRIGAVHAIRVTLAFARIGYGEVCDSTVPELNGLVNELEGLVDKLDGYLAQGLGRDLAGRLQKLDQTRDEVALLRKLERIISGRGLVEFRSTLAMIVDRIERRRFEIAVFGRVSSGKSSLLNHVLGANILPVGVNPITAVPTRLAHGPEPRLTVAFADRRVEHLEAEFLAEFVTEQRNPANTKGVTAITVELPSPQLRDGVVFVDTPGLGGLATAGAAETRAYLPQCDLGVVLINAGATLSEEDLSTIQALYDAGVPASVLLSKADLLAAEDIHLAVDYISSQIQSRLGLRLPVHPVSIVKERSILMDRWFEAQIAPLFSRHQQLAEQSVRRKIGGLREAVEAALRSRVEQPSEASPARAAQLLKAETSLRRAAGRIAEALSLCLKVSDGIRDLAPAVLSATAAWSVDRWASKGVVSGEALKASMAEAVGRESSAIRRALEDVARELFEAIRRAAAVLEAAGPPGEEELFAALKEMPRLDFGPLDLTLRPTGLLLFGKWLASRRVATALRKRIGADLSEALRRYGRALEIWSRMALSGIQASFDAYADGYRAQFGRLLGSEGSTDEERGTLVQDLAEISAWPQGMG